MSAAAADAGGDGSRCIYLHIYGDSLSLPRYTDAVSAADTFPERVQRGCESLWPGMRIQLYNRSQGGATIAQLHAFYAQDVNYFSPDEMDVLVLQCGVVDCAPRPIPVSLRRIIGRLPGFARNRAISFLHHNRAALQTRGFAWQHTPPHEFRARYRQWLESATDTFSRVLALNIAPTTPGMDAHSPGLDSAIRDYNRIIAETVRAVAAPGLELIDVHAAILAEPGGLERCVNPADGHHITVDGHALYSERILRVLGASPPA